MATATLPPTIQPTARRRERLIAALEGVFRIDDLDELVAKVMDEPDQVPDEPSKRVDQLVGGVGSRKIGAIARDLVIELEALDKIPKLIRAMCEMRPDN